jgi:malonate-semialdehyde dehydrogenase (acetylating)/methylmalonate-semialdehyde dehydrogenase
VSWLSSAPLSFRRWDRYGSFRSLSPPATPSSSSQTTRPRQPPTSSPSSGQTPALPHGGFNVLHGDGQTADPLIRHADVAAVSVIGPVRPAHAAQTQASAHGKYAHALGSAKSHMAVLPDADLGLAAGAALSAGIGPTGDCAMAMSVVVVVESVADEFVDRIRRRLRAQGAARAHHASSGGILATRAHRADADRYIGAGLRSGAQLSVDGRELIGNNDPVAFWLGPTVLDHVTPEMDGYVDEVLGPVLLVVRVATTAEALALIRESPFINAVSIFTDEPDAVRRDHGNLGVETVSVNVPIALPMRYRSWGEWSVSLFRRSVRSRRAGSRLLHPCRQADGRAAGAGISRATAST